MNKKEEQLIIKEFIDVWTQSGELIINTKQELLEVVQMLFIAVRVDDWFTLYKTVYPRLHNALKKYEAYKHTTDEELMSMLTKPLRNFLCQIYAVLNEYSWDEIIPDRGSVPFVNNWTVEQIEAIFTTIDSKLQKEYLDDWKTKNARK